ncbi:Npun_R1517 family heterocyst differentiation transcriptional regulator [Leptolyngbya sp. FACHB-261]|uniref:Npun_R1517 family heterocyst differentiation transcriptional regulator n=1 Tax=Leptolyngbya sp. FACHB-261 TaxID=2692806 RepID=UPI0016857AE4|nr:Npun_R1517 family heterocyst differentiation transcriptional regulator [Leptolyngbya sp. FACHB-261]MBD2103840.1 Npun_R1517 family heterocyst differentiation transcriptional regulator [Leptolyngbya sp. FACHB-261]
MSYNSLQRSAENVDVTIYECEVQLKFRLIEERGVLTNREQVLEMLLDALTCGPDEYLEYQHTEVNVRELDETAAAPAMRRQLIRLRNSPELH